MHLIDIRHVTADPSGTILASVDTSSWSSPAKLANQNGANQIVQIILAPCSGSTRLMGLIGPHGSLCVCEIKPAGSSTTATLPSRPLYQSDASTSGGVNPSTAIGLRRAGGLFLPPLDRTESSGPEPCMHWSALTYSGLPELNPDRNLGPLLHLGLPRLHSGPWGGPWGKHRPNCPLLHSNGPVADCPGPYYIRSCSDPVWSAFDSSTEANREFQSKLACIPQTVN
ncbi:unnamed protein product [Echinostoma caproni]|uniref:Uncharacterized protein n=1 Tax=Echinostoma caproni TaxID=27848 RepID=A0A3P8FFW5_9TREM|nr:unnamed protein product [Echinostoma caproni]